MRSESAWVDMLDSMAVLSEEEQQQDSRLVFRDREVLTSRLLLSLSLPSMASLMQEQGQGDQLLLLPFTDSQEVRRSIRGFLGGRWLARRAAGRNKGGVDLVEEGARCSVDSSTVKQVVDGSPTPLNYGNNFGMEGMMSPNLADLKIDARQSALVNYQSNQKLYERSVKTSESNEVEDFFEIWKSESEGNNFKEVNEGSIKQVQLEKVGVALGLEIVNNKKDKQTISLQYRKRNITYSGITLATRHLYMKRVEGNYVCTLCGKTTRHMLEHLESHIKGENYKCDICILSKSFSCMGAMRRHKKERHGVISNTRPRRTKEEAREARKTKEKNKVDQEKNGKKDMEPPNSREPTEKRYTCLCGESFQNLIHAPEKEIISFKKHVKEEHLPDSLEYAHFVSVDNAYHTA